MKWEQWQTEFTRDNYPSKSAGDIAKIVGKSQKCVIEKLKRMGIPRDWEKNRLKHRSIPEYCVWSSMKNRCNNKNDPAYKYYGAKGVKVCDRWNNSFLNFYSDMGPRPRPGLSLDRINPFGDYCPENCRWATVMQQATNKRKPVVVKCSNCGAKGKKYLYGECHTCAEYRRRNGTYRPLSEADRERLRAARMRAAVAKPIIGIAPSGESVRYNAVIDSFKEYGSGVMNCLSGRTKTAYGLIWKYA